MRLSRLFLINYACSYIDLLRLSIIIKSNKIYPDNLRERKKRFEILLQRYRNYLPEDLKKEVIAHAKQDFSEDYRMDESKTIKRLKESGFREAKIIDREAEEAILTASK